MYLYVYLHLPLCVYVCVQVSPGGKAEKSGIVPGDIIISINGLPCKSVKHHEAQKMVITSKDKLALAWYGTYTCTEKSKQKRIS